MTLAENEKWEDLPDFVSLRGANEDDIAKVESEMSVIFTNEYRNILKKYGAFSANGHEIVGICNSNRLSVLHLTKKEKNPAIPLDYYAIERLNMDDMIAWQGENGKIYLSAGAASPICVASSLYEYVAAKR